MGKDELLRPVAGRGVGGDAIIPDSEPPWGGSEYQLREILIENSLLPFFLIILPHPHLSAYFFLAFWVQILFYGISNIPLQNVRPVVLCLGELLCNLATSVSQRSSVISFSPKIRRSPRWSHEGQTGSGLHAKSVFVMIERQT